MRERTAATPVPTAPIVATGLIGGFAAARYTGRRELGGAVLVAAGAAAAQEWLRRSGPGVMGVLLGTYLVSFGVSHPLAKKRTVPIFPVASTCRLTGPTARSNASLSPAALWFGILMMVSDNTVPGPPKLTLKQVSC